VAMLPQNSEASLSPGGRVRFLELGGYGELSQGTLSIDWDILSKVMATSAGHHRKVSCSPGFPNRHCLCSHDRYGSVHSSCRHTRPCPNVRRVDPGVHRTHLSVRRSPKGAVPFACHLYSNRQRREARSSERESADRPGWLQGPADAAVIADKTSCLEKRVEDDTKDRGRSGSRSISF